MSITISFDPNDGEDVAYIQAMLGGGEAEVEAPAPAKKAAPKKAAKPAAEPEPEPEADGEPTLEDAVARATELVGEGRAAEVKGALAQFDVKRVSELSEDQVPAFLEALNEDSVV